MATQTQKGKAFEYACLIAIYQLLENTLELVIVDSPALRTAHDFYESIDREEKIKLDMAANTAARYVARLEPQFCESDGNVPLFLSIQDDAKGIYGDVRDILCYRKQNEWEIGLSCKHNHSAVKHSRLSNDIDFGEKWFSQPCSLKYFSEIDPIFKCLRQFRDEGKTWDSIPNKEADIYVPLLDAFTNELISLDKQRQSDASDDVTDSIPAALLKYLLGHNDFYKIISNDQNRSTTIQAFNFGGSLNRPAHYIKPTTIVKRFPLPTKFYNISYKDKSKNTILVTCDAGWVLSFRIHSARTKVEPSLKFDIQLIGQPTLLHTHDEPWE